MTALWITVSFFFLFLLLLLFYACFKRFTKGLATYANAFSRTLTHSCPYLLGLVEGWVLHKTPLLEDLFNVILYP